MDHARGRFEQARAAINRIEMVLRDYFGGQANEAALREINGALRDLQVHAGAIAQVSENAAGIRGWARILYSPRKHQRWGGPERVRSFILADCVRLHHILSRAARD